MVENSCEYNIPLHNVGMYDQIEFNYTRTVPIFYSSHLI